MFSHTTERPLASSHCTQPKDVSRAKPIAFPTTLPDVDSGSGDDANEKDNDAIISQRRLDFACDAAESWLWLVHVGWDVLVIVFKSLWYHLLESAFHILIWLMNR